MTSENNKFIKTRAADNEPPIGAYATEIPDNRFVVGNMNSQMMYNQTPDKDNGNGNTGSASVGSGYGLDKMAGNIYLEKIASFNGVKKWVHRLITDIKEAPPLNQLGLAGGAVFGGVKLKEYVNKNRSTKQTVQLNEQSLRALHGISRKLNKVNERF